MAEGLLVESVVLGGKDTHLGESIAQRSRRSQRGLEDWRADGGKRGFWAGKTRIGTGIVRGHGGD
jgi:hypothetical protein